MKYFQRAYIQPRAGDRAVDLGGPSVFQGRPKFKNKHKSRCLQQRKLVNYGGQACRLGGASFPGPPLAPALIQPNSKLHLPTKSFWIRPCPVAYAREGPGSQPPLTIGEKMKSFLNLKQTNFFSCRACRNCYHVFSVLSNFLI